MIFVVVLAVGLAIAGVNAWQRLGRSPRARSWSRGLTGTAARKVLVVWPAVAAMAICAGAVGLADGTAWVVPFGLGFLVAALAFAVFLLFPVPVPRVLVPHWYAGQRRAVPRSRRA